MVANDSSGFDPDQDVRLDKASLHVIAHPIRIRLLSELRLRGPATASQLGRRLGESSGATSYHLRQLASHGFVLEDAGHEGKRERWWRAAHRTTYFDPTGDDLDQAAGNEYLRVVARSYSARMMQYVEQIEQAEALHGPAWAKTFTISDWPLQLSLDQAAELNRELFELLNRYRDAAPPAEARLIVVQLQLFPLAAVPE